VREGKDQGGLWNLWKNVSGSLVEKSLRFGEDVIDGNGYAQLGSKNKQLSLLENWKGGGERRVMNALLKGGSAGR